MQIFVYSGGSQTLSSQNLFLLASDWISQTPFRFITQCVSSFISHRECFSAFVLILGFSVIFCPAFLLWSSVPNSTLNRQIFSFLPFYVSICPLTPSVQNDCVAFKKWERKFYLITNTKIFRQHFEAKVVVIHIYTLGKDSRWNELNKQKEMIVNECYHEIDYLSDTWRGNGF